eukprot:12913-Heterococcus_DN1.PRE.1
MSAPSTLSCTWHLVYSGNSLVGLSTRMSQSTSCTAAPALLLPPAAAATAAAMLSRTAALSRSRTKSCTKNNELMSPKFMMRLRKCTFTCLILPNSFSAISMLSGTLSCGVGVQQRITQHMHDNSTA